MIYMRELNIYLFFIVFCNKRAHHRQFAFLVARYSRNNEEIRANNIVAKNTRFTIERTSSIIRPHSTVT